MENHQADPACHYDEGIQVKMPLEEQACLLAELQVKSSQTTPALKCSALPKVCNDLPVHRNTQGAKRVETDLTLKLTQPR
ncbi:hypothetical protein AOXY_G27416 [Acipenser oxyrinchus oxyrinchus]|uniref:Uncharacterized protein n=1 Tax=Acipenser oxyrinchus oxyrinchus TaxID=40147 RepID=A0AAD8CQK8_ACIOX|nr:hypothetical protein AOXY_G32290 [Acipenser oxyrinchus oxyrinchus]KAK1155066.1 hypothetical protein AOXY_G27416 [Acipenser oxyrinchus oxyrinchus]